MRIDAELAAHKAWLGLLQPVGLVVSPPALVKAQAVLDRNVVELQQELLAIVRRPPRSAAVDDPAPYLDDFPTFAERILGWSPDDLKSGDDLPPDLEVVLPDYGETLRPSYAVVDAMADGTSSSDTSSSDSVLLLVQEVPPGTPLDKPPKEEKTGWHASPHAKLERLLREKGVAAGLLSNGHELRIVYAPRGESSGHLTFPVKALCEVAERRVLRALHLLLSEHRVFSAPDGRRLLDLLVESRKYQNEVSSKLSEQVLGALWELLRGFQAADEVAHRRLIDRAAREDPDHVYGGLLTVLLRLVFLRYAEDAGLMPNDEVYARNYSVAGLYERLREDEGRYPDTMDQRYGAWAWLLSLFRLVFDGGGHGAFELPTRHGQLFNPDEFPFLEGRPYGVARVVGERCDVPRVSDGCVYRVLQGLLVLEGERLSYRALDVEQIGSVYEAMMGFSVERAFGRSLALKPKHVVVDVDALLELSPGKRAAWLKDEAECDLAGNAAAALKDAKTVEDVVAALGRKVSPRTQQLQPPGALYLQPGEERRRSGSHYTPRELTEPIVRTTLRPVLEALGDRPTPEQILDLKVCDPAMGSGAFLVEACRQLAEALVRAWEAHDRMPALPPDEDSLLHARRLVAQRCLYGVDKNPFAVNLAKLSLWLVTLAKDHAFTFIDHALKHGDSLVGLSRDQIAAFHWKQQSKDWGPLFEGITESVETASAWRKKIQSFDEGDYEHKKEAWRQAEDALFEARLVGDLVIAAFFGAEKDKAREDLRVTYQKRVDDWRAGAVSLPQLLETVEELRSGERPVPPLHWEAEFPEVFVRDNPGFDAVVGNPPFLGGSRISTHYGNPYLSYLLYQHPDSHGNGDLVAHFFRRVFASIRTGGTAGLIATNTISQGDTRHTGLRYICSNGGWIYNALTNVRWPGQAAVTVCSVHFIKGDSSVSPCLNGRIVEQISAFLYTRGGHDNPMRLFGKSELNFSGSKVNGKGFFLAPIQRKSLVQADPENSKVVKLFLDGDNLNSDPHCAPARFVISFNEWPWERVQRWPMLIDHLKETVKPHRAANNRSHTRDYWWQFEHFRAPLYRNLEGRTRVLVRSFVSKHHCFAWSPTDRIFSHNVGVFLFSADSVFAILQSAAHESWARMFSSTLEDRMGYRPTDCFETFPFPESWETGLALEAAGKTYYEFRAALMIRNDEGLTKTYNRFHDPDERAPDILELRDLHAAMDRAVLDAYGWTDIPTDCEFLLDYEIDEETWGKKKKPYRYRWPEDVHDEVLARLLDLNQKRYQEEVLAGLHAGKKTKQKPAKGQRKASKKTAGDPNLSLFSDGSDV